jgi:hypothetical protein
MKDKVILLIETAMERWPKAKKIAVENFCFSAPADKLANRINLKVDEASYRWNRDTTKAITFVLTGMGKM